MGKIEYFDLVDEYRQPTGKFIERDEDSFEGGFRQVAHVCIFNSKGEMLIQKRSHQKKCWRDAWDVSAGGGVVAGETSRQGAQRELFEELGLKYNFDKLMPHLTMNFDTGFDDYYILNMDIDLSKLKLQETEVCEVMWANKEKVLDMIDNGQFVLYHKNFIALLFDVRLNKGAIERFL